MKAKITYEQLHMTFTDAIKAYTGLTDEITGGNICLNDCLIGEIKEVEKNIFIVEMSISGANYYPRRVANREPNENDINFWIQLIGEENIIRE
jgi:hypothetical protein